MKTISWKMPKAMFGLAGLVILVASAPSRNATAKPLGLTVDVTMAGFITHDESVYRAFGADAWSAIGPTLGAVVWDHLAVLGSYVYATAEGEAGVVPTKLQGHGGLVHLQYRLPLESWIDAYARVTGAVLWAELRLSPGAHRIQDSGITGGAGGTLGIEFHFPREFFWGGEPDSALAGFTFGAFLEAGYLWMADLDFEEMSVTPDGSGAGSDHLLEVGSLGSLNLSGTALRVGLIVHF